MSHALTETATNADFVTPLTVPDNGDDFTASCAVVVAAAQAIANREQWLKSWLSSAPNVRVPLNAFTNGSSRFTAQTGVPTWSQTSVADVGGLTFHLTNLPSGRRITAVTATIANPFTTNIAIGTKPALSLDRTDVTVANTANIGSATDTTAVLGQYQAPHSLTISGLNHTINDNYSYGITFQGETGANSVIGLILYRIYVTLGL